MDDYAFSIAAKQNKNNKRRRSCAPSSRLAIVLSSCVLIAYLACLAAVVLTIDRQETRRNLSISPSSAALLGPNNLKPEDRPFVPHGQWPVSIREEEMETIIHPANPEIQWIVPRFWSPPVHNNILMSREQAMKIGTCAVSVGGDAVRGTDCPLHQRTIFIMIASYRDFQCRETIESIYGRATHPSRIRVGVVDQVVSTDYHCGEPIKPCTEDPTQALCVYANQVDVVTLDAATSAGPVPARHVGHRLYRGEYYAMQSDAHVTYANNWDMSLIAELESTGNDMAVMSTYLSDFVGHMNEKGDWTGRARPIMCNSYFKKVQGGYHLHHSTQPESFPAIHGSPQLHPWWSAGFSFSRGHFVVNVPYDLLAGPMVFSGEEMSIAIRGWTIGYDFYTPERSVCFHHYAESAAGRKKRAGVPTFWENAKAFEGTGMQAMARLLGIVHMNPEKSPESWNHTDEDRYGLGGVRVPEKLYSVLGMDVHAKTIEGHLCHFVNSGKMHRMFVPQLRDDGMGIDYSKIDFQWMDDEKAKEDEEGDDSTSDAGEEENKGKDEGDGKEEEEEEEA